MSVKKFLYKLESFSAGIVEYGDMVKQVMDHLRPHINSEETNDLPKLEVELGDESSAESPRSFTLTKKSVPTHHNGFRVVCSQAPSRPHPSAPDKSPYETLVGFLSTPIDKLKDMFARFPDEGTAVWSYQERALIICIQNIPKDRFL